MTKLSDLGPPDAPKPLGANGHDHIHTCAVCGQLVDRRDIRQVMWHEQPDHEPLELDR